MKKLFIPLLALPLFLTACDNGGSITDTEANLSSGEYSSSGKSFDYDDYDYEVDMVEEFGEPGDLGVSKDSLDTPDKNSETHSENYVVKNASISIEVKNVQEKLSEVKEVAKENEGHVVFVDSKIKDRETTASSFGSNSYSEYDYNYQPDYYNPLGDFAVVNIEVPSGNFEKLVDELAGVGEVVTENVSQADVTSDVYSFESQIGSEKASLDRLEALLDEANSIEEVLQIESHIQQRKSAIAGLEGRMESLKDRSKTSSVLVQLITSVANKPDYEELSWWGKTWENISEASSTSVSFSLVLIAFLAPVSLFLLLGWFIFRVVRQKVKGKERSGKMVMDDPYMTAEVEESEISK